ncbi:peptidoglycan/xylan/chitin deacetylase (PgdA/CDA1 family) [Paenibacillus taihuensis]|uniref:Peptidoglycan/xylan/chitin deacetylase (PgdA/CDA1 family) n=1 Tax=Paenibacillus taihuensis TaxID=1156355 RepID=A0A3D9SMS3_9BACL|nr:polysaccharide deacetylase family protein [Paenibacillus taihuensis]REE94245.1 peptidoglycan/xylan/chitin deacetylase (PgdA/CDA1 family) [Paenibacillus taihuensis]
MPKRRAYQISLITLTVLLALTGCGSTGNNNDTKTAVNDQTTTTNANTTADASTNAGTGTNSEADTGTSTGTNTETNTGTGNTSTNQGTSTNEGSNSGTSNNGEATTPANSNQADTPPATEAPKKLYKMNKVYSFVPIDNATTSNKVVLLTFDDGPKADKTVTALLDTLDKHKAKAIFFVNGYRVKAHPELLKKIADRGQTIGNHSWDHIDLKKESEASVKKQVGDVQQIVKNVTGKEPVFFRPPFGNGNDFVKSVVRGHGMLYMTWSDGSLDWDASTKDKPDKVIANVLDQLHPGVNILMHELPWTTEALDKLLTKLEEKGYGFIDPDTIDLGLDAPTTAAATATDQTSTDQTAAK